MSMLDDIEDIEFSDEALDLFTSLIRCGADDEASAVVLCAAAFLIAEQAASVPVHLDRLTEDFAELVAEVDLRRRHPLRPLPRRVGLRLVGGRDVG